MFLIKSQKLLHFWEKWKVSALEANNDSFQQISVKYLLFPHPDISLMTKHLAQIKIYTSLNTGDVKTGKTE